ncbi:glycosyltransferase [Thermosphaera sp.]
MKIGIAWECPWTASSYGKLALWLAKGLQDLGFNVRIYCPSAPSVTVYGKLLEYKPSCLHEKLGVCVEVEKPVEVSSDAWLCRDTDVDVYVVAGSPYGSVESEWVRRCSTISKPVAGYFVTESEIVPYPLASWLYHVDATAFPAKAVARAFLIHEGLRSLHHDWVLAPHGLPDYYFSLDPTAVLNYGLKLAEHSEALELALRSRSKGLLLGMVGKNHPRKDYGALLSAFLMAKAETGVDDMRLVLGAIKAVGADSWEIELMLDTLGLTHEEVLLVGDEWGDIGITELGILTLYSLMNVHVLATRGEGFGLTAVEAGALGIPSIISDTPVARELWEGYPLLAKTTRVVSEEGFILRYTSVQDLSEKIVKAFENQERFSRLAKSIAEKYQVDVMAKGISQLIDNAVVNAGRKKQHPLPSYEHVREPGYRLAVAELFSSPRF